MQVPRFISEDPESCTADYMVLEFWRGVVLVATCKLPMSTIRQAAASQVTFQAHPASSS